MTGKFTVRVELHGVRDDSDDYERLHEAMAKKGFRKYLSYDDGKNKFQLPTAEYRYFSDAETNEQVAQKAYDIADTIKRNPSVISTEGDVAKRNLKKFDAT